MKDTCVVLFSGGGSAERVIAQVLPNACILYIDTKQAAHINVLEDIRSRTTYPDSGLYDILPGTVKMVWASPLYRYYSIAHTIGEIAS